MSAGLTDFFKYNLWAHHRLLDTCASLTDEQLDNTMTGTFGTIRETLMHMIGAEEGYVSSFNKLYPTIPPLKEITTFPSFDELRRRIERSGAALLKIAQEADLGQIFYLDGGTYESPAIIVVIQVVDHAIDHRSQICTLLTQQGLEAPDIDAWAYNDATLHKD